MSRQPPLTSAIADRLRAHARLCKEIAEESWSAATARKLRRMARDCERTAAEIIEKSSNGSATRH